MSLEDLFSRKNFLSYARACRDISLDIIDKKFDTLLIPSRGAVPILNCSLYALEFLGKEDKAYLELLKKFYIPDMIKKYTLSKSLENIVKGDSGINILLCPFTADINMEKLNADSNIYTDYMRAFWTRVIKACFDEPEKRKKDEFFQFYMFLLKMEKRKDLIDDYTNQPKIKNLAMIDTGISGRAASTILDRFNDIGIDPYTFLIVDQNGKRLKYPYKQNLENRKYSDKLKMYKMNHILSEDRGAALLGVTAIVYPSLMLMGSNLELKKGRFFPVGAGSWRPLPKQNKFEKSFDSFIKTVKTSIAYVCTKDFSVHINEGEIEKYNDDLEKERHDLIKILKEEKLLEVNPEDIDEFKKYYKTNDVYETNSHVVHVCFSNKRTIHILNEFKREFEKN